MGEQSRTPTWRSYRRRVTSVTVEELRLLFDWSLPGPRLYRLSQGDRFYIVAKVVVETDEPVYPCRPSEHRAVSGGSGVRVGREFPCWDESKSTYPTGRFTTWLATDEIRHALAHGCLIQCHEAFIARINVEHNRSWQKLRNQMFRLYGRACMRCGCTHGEMHIDHIKPWSKAPELRYDPENLQVLCRACHAWKEAQGREMDFRRPGTRPSVQ